MTNTPEKTEAEYEQEFEQLEAMFPDAKFTVSIPIEDIDEVVSTEPTIMVKCSYNCHCYSESPKVADWFNIRCNNDGNITNRTILMELMNNNLSLECDHHFIEGFDMITDVQFNVAAFS